MILFESMELGEIRQQLDDIDTRIMQLIADRVNLIPAIAHYKEKKNLPRRDEKREAEIKKKIKLFSRKQKINPDLLEKIMDLLIAESHRIEKEILGR